MRQNSLAATRRPARSGRLAQFALLALGGLAIAGAFLDARAWPFAWVGLIPLFRLAPRARSVSAAALGGWVMGLATNVPAFYWLVTTIHRFGEFPLPVALLFYAVLSAYGALQFGLVAAALRWAGPGAPVLLAPALWTASEVFFPNLFPWRLAHSQRVLTPLIQIGDLTGPYGLSFVMAWVASATVRAPSSWRRLAGPLCGVLALFAYGSWRAADVRRAVAAAPPFTVGIVQGNLALAEKRHAEHFEGNVARYRRLSRDLQPKPDLLVWPETVVEWGLPRDGDLVSPLDPYPGGRVPLLFGAVSYGPGGAERDWFNSAFLRSADGRIVGLYDKIVLMPFGEFIPLASVFPSLKGLSPNTGDFTAGAGPAVLPVSAEARLGPLICYEDLLAGHVRETVRRGATVLVTMANDAWFGASPALRQHETLGLWRAIENRRYLVRATNTGLTSVIDPLGASVASLPIETEAALTVDIRLLSSATPYQRFGDLFAGFVLALAVLLLIWSRRAAKLAAPHESSSKP